MKKIGVLGGTFDPVHNEHVKMANEVIKELKLDKLIVMPTACPPHKVHSEMVDATHRLNMANLAFVSPKITVSDYEINEGGKSYTYKTLEHIKKTQEDAEIFFIVGGDMLVDFKTWKFPERILEVATLAVFNREGYHANYDEEEKYFEKNFSKSFIRLNFSGKNVSSTKIRIYSMFGLDVTPFVPDLVASYIKENNLYKANAYVEFVKSVLPEKRLIHTANVIACALDKAKPLNVDRDDVFTACTLHDVAKYLKREDYPLAEIPDDMPSAVVHAFLGEYVAREKLGIKNQDILNAIKYHTSGRENMSNLEKLVFVADMVEEGRTYDGVDELRKLYDVDFEKCFIECLKEEMIHLKNKKTQIFYLTEKAYDYYVK